MSNDLARAAALSTRASDDEEALLIAKLARPAALRTRFARRACGRAGAFAGLAVLLARNLNRRLSAFVRLREVDLEVEAQVRAARRAAAASAASAESKEVAEDVGEVSENVGIESGAGARRTTDARVAEAIVARALLGVAQDGVRFRRLFELVFSFLVAGVAIRMELQRQLSIRALDLGLAGVTSNAEHFVIISPRHARATLTCAGRRRR